MEIVTENATSLAWIGDAVISVHVRVHLVKQGYQNPHKLQKMSSVICCAKGQSKILQQMIQNEIFTQEELEILRRGRNANIHSRAKHASAKEYLDATALESCFGYLYLYKHEERLNHLLEEMMKLGEML